MNDKPDNQYSISHLDAFCRKISLVSPINTILENTFLKFETDSFQVFFGIVGHLDFTDCDFPLSAMLTSASVHDSQVAIPLMKLTAGKVISCYDLMVAAYDAAQIWEMSRELVHLPIIDRNPRGKDIVPMAPHEAQRHTERTVAERGNGRLKDELGARCVQVRGPSKFMMHLMFGILALFADRILRFSDSLITECQTPRKRSIRETCAYNQKKRVPRLPCMTFY